MMISFSHIRVMNVDTSFFFRNYQILNTIVGLCYALYGIFFVEAIVKGNENED